MKGLYFTIKYFAEVYVFFIVYVTGKVCNGAFYTVPDAVFYTVRDAVFCTMLDTVFYTMPDTVFFFIKCLAVFLGIL